MEKRNKIILAIVAILFLAAISSMFYIQQRTINVLKEEIMPSGIPDQNQAPGVAPTKALTDEQIKEATAQLTENTKEIDGKITGLTENSMNVEAQIVDISKISEAPAIDQLPKIKKTFKVAVNDQTELPNFKMKDFQVGQTAKVFSNELVYKTDSLTAAKIIPYTEQVAADSQKPKPVSGRVESINSNVLVIKSLDADQKEYTVRTNAGTKFFKVKVTSVDPDKKNFKTEQLEIKLSDILQNDAIEAVPAKDFGSSSEFEAASVTVLPLAPPK